MKQLTRQILVILTSLIALTVNILANALPINGITTAEISDKFDVYFVPAGYVFAIWGVISIGMIAFAIYQAFPAQRNNPRLVDIGWWVILGNLANTAWIFFWHYELFPLTLISMLILLSSLLAVYLGLNKDHNPVPAEKWMVTIPFSIYLGWISVATIANISDLLSISSWGRFGLSEQTWMVIILLIIAALAWAVSLREKDTAFLAVLLWALAGIGIKFPQNGLVTSSTWLVFGAVGLAFVYALYQSSKRNSVMKLFSALLVVLILLASAPFLVPVPPLEDTVPIEELADADSRFIEVNGVQVHYKTAGSGEPVMILLHGFGASLFSWHSVMPELAQYGTVIAYDRPAFGLTERPLTWEGQNPYSPEAQIELVIGLMDALEIEQVILIGNSAGGTVAFGVALEHPERVQALVAVDAAVYAGGGAPAFARPLLSTPQLRYLGPLIARQISNNGDDFIRSAWHDPSNITQETMEGYHKPLRAEYWDQALWELTAASSASNLAEKLDLISLPVLVITGDDDRIVPTEQSLRLAEELQNAVLSVIQDCGHLPHEEKPQAFVQVVSEFLSEISDQ